MANVVLAGITNRDETFNGRKVMPLIIRGIVEPGGTEQVFNGTIQEINEQIHNINPNFSWKDFQSNIRNPRRSSTKRYTSKVLCHVQNLPSASREAIEEIQLWLNNTDTAVEMQIDAQRCSRISCTKNAAVWACNDNLQWIQKVTLTLGSSVGDILKTKDCQDPGNSNLIQGQAFDTENFNVIVNGDVCA
ncbi:hypothetical protein F5Y06DRAFT_298276 [Hypoxylon sp. FL0890]|nr:hypothetical protein F5Y06DRAFT_298276 [Hypoxylon sp. FL0890]